ncbi:nuclear transport factor 2 family protein [Flectobacillus roseus]|uniref:nuclear transport factor 2 family protein n=1 Tax=Flectobacillus roseus TaxID=502259 RepID=UPI0024B6C1F0|nr:nuclear transport factor 2 family protein [Flectobacillus roseus]MDI9871197.1 nuclear transport factor 2 family protein [Flectobacillus roseus]
MKKLSITLLLLVMATLGSIAQSKDEKAVAESVEKLRLAMIDPTKEALENIATEDLSYGHSGGKIENKAQFVEALVSGKSDFKSIQLTDQTISIHGKTAIVRHSLAAETLDGGKPGTVKLFILTVWSKEKGGWKLLARQAVKNLN